MKTLNQLVDLDKLDEYIVIQMVEGVKLSADDDDLRVLEQTLGPAVHAIWSDARQSVVAFLFDKLYWDKASADAWITKAQEEAEDTPLSEWVAAQSFDRTRELVEAALAVRFKSTLDAMRADDQPAYIWVTDMGPSTVIFSLESKRYSTTYTIDADEEVTFGDIIEVTQQWVRPDGTPVTLDTQDEGRSETDENLSRSPLFAFWGSLGDGTEAEDDDTDGLTWKEVLHPGKWFKTDTGTEVEVTPDIVEGVYRSFTAGFPRHVSVPADHHYLQTRGIVPPEVNRGFVKQLKLIDDRLFAGFDIRHKETAQGVRDGTIADVSVYLQPNVHDNRTGQKHGWVLRHVLLTNNPLVPDLAPFGDIPASDANAGQALVFNHVQREQEGIMPGEDEITLSGEAAVEYQSLQEHGYTSARLLALAEQHKALESEGLSVEDLIAQARAVRAKSRELEVTKIVAALEGAGEHESVVRIEGYRHLPAVVEAVSKALTESVEGLALSADADGHTPVDGVILSLVNALPETARIALADRGARKDQNPGGDERDGDVSDEAVDQFLTDIGSPPAKTE